MSTKYIFITLTNILIGEEYCDLIGLFSAAVYGKTRLNTPLDLGFPKLSQFRYYDVKFRVSDFLI